MLCQYVLCRRKVTIIMKLTNLCRCKKYYCHIHISDHECIFDYKQHQRDNLSKVMIKVVREKIDKI